MKSYSITMTSEAWETFELEAESRQEAERLVQEAMASGTIYDDERFKLLGYGNDNDWQLSPGDTIPKD